jgi:hypothetical protein
VTRPRRSRRSKSAARTPHSLLPVRIVLGIVLGLVLLNFVVALAKFDWFALSIPYEIDYGEGILLQNAINLAHGREVYNNYHHYPYVVATYPPIYPLLCAAGVRLFGVSFTFARLLSILSGLGAGVLIWLMLRRAGTSRFGAGFGAMLFVAAPSVCLRAVVIRVDMVALVISLAGLYCVMRGGRWLLPAVVLFVLAVYTRQSQVGPLVASIAYLWWTRQRRDAALVAGSFAALTAVIFLVLQFASHGWFYRHVILANMNFWELKRLIEIWQWTFPTWRFPFLIGGVGVALTLFARGPTNQDEGVHPHRREHLLLVWYFVVAMLITVTAGKVGSYVNYMLEPLAAASLMSGVAYQRLAEMLLTRGWRVAWAAAWLLMVVPPAWVLGQPGRTAYAPFTYSPETFWKAGNEVAPLLRRTKGEVLSENTGLLLMTGHRILLDSHKMTSMYHDGNWDQRPLLRDIERRRFALIIITWDPVKDAPDRWGCYGWYRWSWDMGEAIKRNYYTMKHAGDLYVMAPADTRHPSAAKVRAWAEKMAREQQQ